MSIGGNSYGIFSIGVNAVSASSHFGDLNFAANDAIQFSREMRDMFAISHEVTITDSIEVSTGLLPTRNRILLELNNFAEKLVQDKISGAVVLFTGHGMHTESGFVFCCRDFEIDIPEVTGIVMDDVLSMLSKYEGRKIFVFDCCRSYYDKSRNEFSNKVVLPDIRQRLSLNDTVFYSCRPGETSIELGDFSSKFGGIFIGELISCLRKRSEYNVDLSHVYPMVKENVSAVASEYKCEQTPTVFGADMSDFVLFRKHKG